MGAGGLERGAGALKRSGSVLPGWGGGVLRGPGVSGAGLGFQREARAADKALEPGVGVGVFGGGVMAGRRGGDGLSYGLADRMELTPSP